MNIEMTYNDLLNKDYDEYDRIKNTTLGTVRWAIPHNYHVGKTTELQQCLNVAMEAINKTVSSKPGLVLMDTCNKDASKVELYKFHKNPSLYFINKHDFQF